MPTCFGSWGTPCHGKRCDGFGSSLRALERPDSVFSIYAISAIVSVSFGLSLTAVRGLFGAVVSIAFSYVITAFGLWIPCAL